MKINGRKTNPLLNSIQVLLPRASSESGDSNHDLLNRKIARVKRGVIDMPVQMGTFYVRRLGKWEKKRERKQCPTIWISIIYCLGWALGKTNLYPHQWVKSSGSFSFLTELFLLLLRVQEVSHLCSGIPPFGFSGSLLHQLPSIFPGVSTSVLYWFLSTNIY